MISTGVPSSDCSKWPRRFRISRALPVSERAAVDRVTGPVDPMPRRQRQPEHAVIRRRRHGPARSGRCGRAEQERSRDAIEPVFHEQLRAVAAGSHRRMRNNGEVEAGSDRHDRRSAQGTRRPAPALSKVELTAPFGVSSGYFWGGRHGNFSRGDEAEADCSA